MIFAPQLEYPVLARQSHVSGTVVIEAVIDEHGNVIEARALSGHPLLVPAALKAVSLRKYEPTILDGEPTPVTLRVEVDFHG
jgi:protein TonB